MITDVSHGKVKKRSWTNCKLHELMVPKNQVAGGSCIEAKCKGTEARKAEYLARLRNLRQMAHGGQESGRIVCAAGPSRGWGPAGRGAPKDRGSPHGGEP